jgi:hypothetical protein
MKPTRHTTSHDSMHSGRLLPCTKQEANEAIINLLMSQQTINIVRITN